MTSGDDFEVGRTYFALFYMDEQLRQPIVETLIYLGPDTVDEEGGPAPGHLFQYASSFYRDGNWNELPEQEQYAFEEPPIISFPHEHRDHVVDVDGLIAELEVWKART